MKSIFSLFVVLTLASCAQLKSRKEIRQDVKKTGDQVFTMPGGGDSAPGDEAPMDEHPVDAAEGAGQSSMVAPKISVVISGGGAKSIAALGVIKAFREAKIPIHSVAGVEFGSLIAALYAKNNSVNDVEWQLSKIKDTDFGKPLSNKDLNKMLDSIWKNESVESFATPFSCTSLNLNRKKSYILAKGSARQVLSFCLPYPPLFEAVGQSYAAPKAIAQLFRHQFRLKADIIVFVNVLNERDNDYAKPVDSMLNLLWVENQIPVENERIYSLDVPARNYDIRQVSAYRELIELGEKSAKRMIENLQKSFGL